MSSPRMSKDQTLKFLEATEKILAGPAAPSNQTSNVKSAFEDRKYSAGPDLKKIELPGSLVESIVGFSLKKEVPTPTKIIEEVEEVVEETLEESAKSTKLESLVLKLSSLLKEAKTLIGEMTTSGMIGTNQKFALGKVKKKNGLAKTDKRN